VNPLPSSTRAQARVVSDRKALGCGKTAADDRLEIRIRIRIAARIVFQSQRIVEEFQESSATMDCLEMGAARTRVVCRLSGRSDGDMCESLTSPAVASALDEGPTRRGQGFGVPPSGNRSFIEQAVFRGISQRVFSVVERVAGGALAAGGSRCRAPMRAALSPARRDREGDDKSRAVKNSHMSPSDPSSRRRSHPN
jgi:hypothetical protein